MFRWIFLRLLRSFGSAGSGPTPEPKIVTGTWADVTATGLWADTTATGTWADVPVTGSWGD